jgi:CHAT domain-containing protein
MYADRSVCVLEIARQADCLTMSIFDSSELSSTIKHYSQLPVSLPQINRICQEIIPILNEAGKRRQNDPDLLARMKKVGQFLWDHLLTGQVKNKLKAAQFKELIISLDEDLITIPWELLYDGNDFLCLKFNLGRLVRTRQQQRAVQYRCAGKVLKMLVLADPTADLKAAYQEGVLIKNQFDCQRDKVKIDFKSTDIDTVYVKKNLRDYDIVHFAGHCEYDGSSRQAGGWLLSDGRIYWP